MKSIYRLIYKSMSTQPIDDMMVKSIEERSKDNNSRLEVTGILVASQSEFLQVLEGRIEAVNQVYSKIMRDTRHVDVTLLSYSLVEGRAFEDWSMKCVTIGLLGKWIDQNLQQKYGQADAGFTIPQDGQRAFALLYDVRAFLKGAF
jgi:hypothetical protein